MREQKSAVARNPLMTKKSLSEKHKSRDLRESHYFSFSFSQMNSDF